MTLTRTSPLSSPRRWALVLSALLAACGPGPGNTEGGPDQDDGDALSGALVATFQNGVSPTASYAGVTDAMLQESAPTRNQGGYPFIQLDRDYEVGSNQSVDGLLRFELSGIPQGSTVQAVQLTLNVTNGTSGEGYAVYPARKPWSQALATWNVAEAGSGWSVGGARGSADRGGTSFATLTPSAAGKYTVSLNAAGVAEVQRWLTTPASNLGFVLDANANKDGLVFDSSEAGTAGNRPQLKVTYSLPAPPNGNGTGLLGQYYSGTNFGTLLLSRTDATVGFNWGSGSPGAGVPADRFSVRWTGKVTPRYSETYTFTTRSDDGVRLTVNGQQLINNWTDHAATQNSGTLALTAGHAYDLQLEFYENGGQAVSTLSWASASQPLEIVPQSQLTPATVPTPPADDGVFSMVVMPDVQREMWTPAGQDNWHNRLQWIIDHKASLDIRFVMQVGDLTDTDSCGAEDIANGMCSPALQDFGTYYPIAGQPTHYQFVNADSGIRMLEAAKIPFALTPGNHDTAIVCGGPACYGHPEWNVPTSGQRNLVRVTNAWNEWFPPSRFQDAVGTFEAGKSDNMYQRFTAGGVSWLVINLELWARVEAINWAKGVIAAHPEDNVIVLTHSYLNGDGSVMGSNGGYGSTAPTYVRDNLVKAFPNVKFTFSGHVGRSAHHTEQGAQGNTVHSFLDCYHDTTNNLLRVVTFDIPNNKITTYVYAPKTDRYEVTSQVYDVQFIH